MIARSDAPRISLFRKYFRAFFVVVSLALLVNGAIEAWAGYRDQRTMIDARLKIEASAAAGRIQGFLDGIRDQMGWAVQLPWTLDNISEHQLDALRLFRQVPAMVELTLVDGEGTERVRVSRIGEDVVDSGVDRSNDPAVVGLGSSPVWYGPITLNRGSEPYMKMAVSGNRSSAGAAIADINLTLIWDVISSIRVGKTGLVFIIDSNTRLVAHPDIGLMLKGADSDTAARLQALRETMLTNGGEPVIVEDFVGRSVIATAVRVETLDWLVIAEQPTSEAFAPIFASMQRTALLVLAAAALAMIHAYVLARRMTGPIRMLEEGATRIGAGRFDHRINLATGDELEHLAERFNQMADDLALSQERSERIARLKRFLSPPVADIVERTGDGNLLDARRAEVAVVFADLRGFTEFSVGTEPEEIMQVIEEYYTAVGECIARSEATLTHFSGDGLMVLLNAPVPCPEDPAVRAVRMALEMQASVQAVIVNWRGRGHRIGFGIGLAKGTAIVGRVGYEGRYDYTAIGNVVNLASRLCSFAGDGQILMNPVAASDVADTVALTHLGSRTMKGFSEPVPVYAVAGATMEGSLPTFVALD